MRPIEYSLLAFVLVVASVDARATAAVYSRSTTDTCANVNGQLTIPFLGLPVNIGPLGMMLSESARNWIAECILF